MKVKINGEFKDISSGTTVLELIKQLKLNPERIVVEYNGEIIEKAEYDRVLLKENDKLELIHFVGGG